MVQGPKSKVQSLVDAVFAGLVWAARFIFATVRFLFDLVKKLERTVYRFRMQLLALMVIGIGWHMVEEGHIGGTDFLLIVVGPLFGWIHGRGHARDREDLVREMQAVRGDTFSLPEPPQVPPLVI